MFPTGTLVTGVLICCCWKENIIAWIIRTVPCLNRSINKRRNIEFRITFTYPFSEYLLGIIYYVPDAEDTTWKLRNEVWLLGSLYSSEGTNKRHTCTWDGVPSAASCSLESCVPRVLEEGWVFLLSPPRLGGATFPSGKDRGFLSGLAPGDPPARATAATAEALCPRRFPWYRMGSREPARLRGGPGSGLWAAEEGCLDNDEFALKYLHLPKAAWLLKRFEMSRSPLSERGSRQ